ncbi:hypothetical protein C0Q70_08380 [Pomacea canaliculata]|uniref:Uncharacterized protein n=1 Tax=Pomacea canaliculata TaxID=400727 RepID=A0A2T7PHN5_POMCA|nr:hypothetical protein C0Q70_08380 [Pomacea canaliculata]
MLSLSSKTTSSASNYLGCSTTHLCLRATLISSYLVDVINRNFSCRHIDDIVSTSVFKADVLTVQHIPI